MFKLNMFAKFVLCYLELCSHWLILASFSQAHLALPIIILYTSSLITSNPMSVWSHTHTHMHTQCINTWNATNRPHQNSMSGMIFYFQRVRVLTEGKQVCLGSTGRLCWSQVIAFIPLERGWRTSSLAVLVFFLL